MLLITFHNDSTGTEKVGNYNVEVYVNYRLLWKGRVEKHKRERGWRQLLRDLVRQSSE